MRTSTSATSGCCSRCRLDRLRGVRDGAGELEGRLGGDDTRENRADAVIVLGDQHSDAGVGLHYL